MATTRPPMYGPMLRQCSLLMSVWEGEVAFAALALNGADMAMMQRMTTVKFFMRGPYGATMQNPAISAGGRAVMGRAFRRAQVLLAGILFPAAVSHDRPREESPEGSSEVTRHVQEHQDALQLRAARDRIGDPRGIDPVRAEAERLRATFEGERTGVR